MKRTWSTWLVLALASMTVAGCSQDLQRQLGLTRTAPDEFQVQRREPLRMPPSMAELPPPEPGTLPLAEDQTSEEARKLLIGDAAATQAEQSERTMSEGERMLLAQTQDKPADPQIRQKLAEDQTDSMSISQRTFLFIAFWQKPDDQDEGHVVDPVKEAQRLQQAGIAASSRPLTMRVGSVSLAAPPVN